MKTLESFFSHYGASSNYSEERINLYFTKADHIQNMNDLKYNDNKAIQSINELLEYVEVLKEYRKSLQERSLTLLNAQSKIVLSFKREKTWKDSKVYYHLRLKQVFDKSLNINPIDTIKEDFTGKERQKAFMRFNELKKIYYGAELEIDIDKKSWEK